MVAVTSRVAEEFAIQLLFLVGGIFTIINMSSLMHRLLLKIRPFKEPSSKLYTTLASENAHRYCNDTSNHVEKNSRNDFKNHKTRYPIANNSSICRSTFPGKDPLVAVKDRNQITDHFKLLQLFFVCCLCESFFIIVNAVLIDSSLFTGIEKACNLSAQVQDCFIVNAIFLLQRNYVSVLLETLLITSLSTFPIIFYSLTYCSKDNAQSLICSIIVFFFVLLSRCIGFLFLPSVVVPVFGFGNNFLQRLISSWVAFISLSIGLKFSLLTEWYPLYIAMKTKQDMQDDISGALYKEKAVDLENEEVTFAKRANTLHDSKRYFRRTSSEMTFGSDAFVPCVVLMKKQSSSPYRQTVSIGTSARAPRARRRASLDVIKENNNIEETVKWSEMLSRRRTSLPNILAGSKKKAVMSSVLVDSVTLAELHNVVEKLSQKPENFLDFVKKLQDVLSPYKLDHVKPRQVVWLQKSGNASDEDPVCISSTRHAAYKRATQRRSDWQTGLFSTTTTATGLPKEEPGPLKPKRLPKIPKDRTPLGTPIGSRCGSPAPENPTHYDLSRRRTYPSIPTSHSQKFSFSYVPTHYHNVTKKNSLISPQLDSDAPSAAPSPTVTNRSRSVADNFDNISASCRHYLPENHAASSSPCAQECSVTRITCTPPPCENSALVEEEDNSGRHGNLCNYEQIDEGHVLFQKYQEKLLESVYHWNFQIFELAEKTNCVLSQMAFKLFQDTGLFETFNIPKKEFVCYMKALENGYREIPYHNKIHAADVLHGCWFLSTQEIPGFQERSPLFSSDSSDSESGTCITGTRQVNNIGHGSLAQAIPALELLSLYLAASMHDYDHPGRTNAFLVETRHPLAILYNDRSVLENHHASAAWNLLYSNKNFDFLRNLDTAEWKRLRFLIVEAILATDLKKHSEILSQFSAKSEQTLCNSTSTDDIAIDRPRRSGINWSSDEDRLLVCKMVIKLADIGGPAKVKPIHITWTKAICEEFFIQGDDERRLSVPVSPFMDRAKPQVAELQRTFINNLIKRIILSMLKAGILAGEIPEDHDLWIDKLQSADQNLLYEQLKSNLNFWKTKNSLNGHEEMMEAFQEALPLCLNDRNRSIENKPSERKAQYVNDVTKATFTDALLYSKNEDDEVFDDAISEMDNRKVTSSYCDIDDAVDRDRLDSSHRSSRMVVTSNSVHSSFPPPITVQNDT